MEKLCNTCKWWSEIPTKTNEKVTGYCCYDPMDVSVSLRTTPHWYCSKWQAQPPLNFSPECGNCTYWFAYQTKLATRGDCRRNAPPPATTDRRYWCGEWEYLDNGDKHNKQAGK